MKNLSLAAILIGLIGLAYYIDHTPNEIKKSKRSLISQDELRSVEFNDVHIFKQGSLWQLKNLDLEPDQQQLKKLSELISSIIIDSEILKSNHAEFFVDTTIDFSLNETKYRLGDVSQNSGLFYLKDLNQNRLYLARLDLVTKDIYRSEAEKEIKKYLLLVDYLSAKKTHYTDRRIFRALSLDDLFSLKIDNSRNRWFEASLKKRETTPAIPKALQYKDYEKNVLDYLKNVKALEIYDLKSHNLTEEKASMILKFLNQKYEYKLYDNMDGKPGSYLASLSEDKVYSLHADNRDFFFLNVQDFWNKRITYGVELTEDTSFKFKLFDLPFKVKDLKSFEVIPLAKNVLSLNKNNFNFVFNVVFGLLDFKEAKFVETYQTDLKFPGIKIPISLFDKNLAVYLSGSLVTVVNYSDKLVLHYKYQNSYLNITSSEDFFTMKVKN